MKNRWDDQTAAAYTGALQQRVYTSRLLGADSDLVMHGGGNTSVKGKLIDVFGRDREVLFVKGSGWDLKTIEAAGFPATDLHYLLQLGRLPGLSDSEMMKQLRLALLDPAAPTPSVEAILHALIPLKFVDHSHADAVVTLSNTPDGERHLRSIYGDEVLILPYLMPGFILARQVAEATRNADWQRLRGIVLMHHGIFTFADDAKRSYDTMVELVSRAERCLEEHGALAAVTQGSRAADDSDYLNLARLRNSAAAVFGRAVLLRWDRSAAATGFASLHGVEELVSRGPLTPDHTIHTKAFGAAFAADPIPGLRAFQKSYRDYFDRHAQSHHQCLDLMPRFGVWRDRGLLYLAPNLARLRVVADITSHTITAIQWGEAMGGWMALPYQDLFAVEYWELEQAKLRTGQQVAELEGKVALVTGAASGIGKATVMELAGRGAVVAALDINPEITGEFAARPTILPLICDVTDADALKAALQRTVETFGGLDMLISNAGSFPASATITEMDDARWSASLELNLSSHMKLLRAAVPYLQYGVGPAVVIIGSKNVPAPGPGAAAYSVAKAGLTQLARVAALELGASGIRVNVVHPNAVFDTGIWTDEVLSRRAASYGLSVEDYKRNNVLRTEVTSRDVALMAAFLVSDASRKTTAAQIPVDGGNDRVI